MQIIIKKIKQLFRIWVSLLIDPYNVISLFKLPIFLFQWLKYRYNSKELVSIWDLYPCLKDSLKKTPFDPHYFYLSAWLARKIYHSQPEIHVDVFSSERELTVTCVVTILCVSGDLCQEVQILRHPFIEVI